VISLFLSGGAAIDAPYMEQVISDAEWKMEKKKTP
jgi:hypothetical protein